MLSPLLFAIAVDVISENAREGLPKEILYADVLVLLSESMENLKELFEIFESKGLNLKKTKVIESGSKGEILKCKVNPCFKCGKRVLVNSLMCIKCSKWVHNRGAKMKKMTSTLAKDFV